MNEGVEKRELKFLYRSFGALNQFLPQAPGFTRVHQSLAPVGGQIRRIVTIVTPGGTGGKVTLIDLSPPRRTLQNLKIRLFFTLSELRYPFDFLEIRLSLFKKCITPFLGFFGHVGQAGSLSCKDLLAYHSIIGQVHRKLEHLDGCG